MRGLLVRQIPVRLVNLSLSGFLLESDSELDIGSTGELQVDLGGAKYSDQVRVARTVARPGATHPYHLGGEFSWGKRPTQDSMRLAVRAIETDGQPQS
jgi:hypothetical protein